MSHSFRRHQVAVHDVKRVVCPTGKTGFTKGVAEQRLASYAGQDNSRGRQPVRVYECQHCGHWHLTSRELR